MLRHPIPELNSKAVKRSFPVSYWHRPFSADVLLCKIKQFYQRLIRRKRATVLGNLPQAHVQRLNRIDGVDHPPEQYCDRPRFLLLSRI